MLYEVPAESVVEMAVKSEYELFPEGLLIVFKETLEIKLFINSVEVK